MSYGPHSPTETFQAHQAGQKCDIVTEPAVLRYSTTLHTLVAGYLITETFGFP